MSFHADHFAQSRRWNFPVLLLAVALAPTLGSAQDYSQQQPYPAQAPYGQPQGDPSQADPPSRVARISVMQGNVSLQPAGVEDFSPAGLNYPLTTGDRLYSDVGALAELEAGGIALRLGSGTDLSVTSMTDQLAQFGLGQGSVHVRSYDLDPNSTLEVDTPNIAVTMLAPGDLRVDVAPDGTSTQVTLLSGQARVDAPGFQQQLQPGESLQLTGSEPVYAQDVRRPRGDNLDRFSSDRDRTFESAVAANSDYVNPDMIGASDLGQYGDWSNDGDYGPVWYPRGLAVDWQPYSVGRWAYIAPWGWTWVGNEPWGFAPFHYGRWGRFGARWGWIPGPRIVRPVYSPALVAFVGGGAGVTAWFPLGPREPYVPWYRTSSLYANRINVSNIYNRNTVEVRNIYNQRTTNVYINNTTVNRIYVNRQVATIAVPQNAFSGGRPVREASMHVQGQQFANAPVLSRPMATPTRSIMAPAPAKALPPRINRPAVESRAPAFQPGGPNSRGQGDNRPANGFGNGIGNGGNNAGARPGAYGAPANGNAVQPGRAYNPQQPVPAGQQSMQPTQAQPAQGQPGRGANSGQSGRPTYIQGAPIANPREGQPSTLPAVTQPANGNVYPNQRYGEQPGVPARGDGMRNPTPGTVNPGAQNINRGDGRNLTPETATPATQNNRDGSGGPPDARQQPGRTVSPSVTPQAPINQQPTQRMPGQGSRDYRGQPPTAATPGAASAQPAQAPTGNIRQWQRPDSTSPRTPSDTQQTRPQPMQVPREQPSRNPPPSGPAIPMPPRQSSPQPVPVARPAAPAPARQPTAAAPPPSPNHPVRDDDKKH